MTKHIVNNGAKIVFRSIVSGRNTVLVKVFNTGRRIWAINAKGQLFTDAYADIKCHRWHGVELQKLQSGDISALCALGFLDVATAHAEQLKAKFDSLHQSELRSIEYQFAELKNWGVKVTPLIRKKAEAWAMEETKKHMKRWQERVQR
jgi:hypothetical protein